MGVYREVPISPGLLEETLGFLMLSGRLSDDCRFELGFGALIARADFLSEIGPLLLPLFYNLSPAAIWRKPVMSRNGGAPNSRLYSRLNWEGLPNGQDRRERDLRQLRFPQHPAPLHAGGAQGEPGPRRSFRQDRRTEESYTGPDRARLAAGAEAVDRADPGHHEAAPPGGNTGAVAVELTADDLGEIDSAAAQVKIEGARYPEKLEQLTGR
jgi:hypothetical protein